MKIKKISGIFLILAGIFLTGCNGENEKYFNGSRKFYYYDNLNKKHWTYVNKDGEPNRYKPKFFRKKGHNLMTYRENGFVYRLGIDVSSHDKDVDWMKVKESGVEFVILRCGYRGYQSGKLNLDKKFHENIKGALEQGLKVGVYIFSQAINEEEALEEAEFVLEQVKDYKIELPLVFDPENIPWEEARTDEVKGEVFTKNAVVFCNQIKEAGYEPMIYANITWQAEMLDMGLLKDIKWWYADYRKKPQSPYHWEFLQYDCYGKVPGISTICDMDIWITPENTEN